MNIHIVTFAYGLADDLVRSYEASTGDNTTHLLILHSLKPDVVAACEQLAAKPNVVYFAHGENRGMSRSVNEAIIYAQEHGADVFMSINDDVIAGVGDVQRIADMVLAEPDCSYVDGEGYVERVNRTEPLGLSFAALNMRAFKRIGYFDENFYPFYFEDADWKRRARLAGMLPITVSTSAVHGGSKTLTNVEGEWEDFGAKFNPNRDYYVAKWGGDQGQEQFAVPFNDPRYDLTIARDKLHMPYRYHAERSRPLRTVEAWEYDQT